MSKIGEILFWYYIIIIKKYYYKRISLYVYKTTRDLFNKKTIKTTTQLGRPQLSSNYFMWPSKAMTKWWMRQRKTNADGSLPTILSLSASVWVQVKKINKWHSWSKALLMIIYSCSLALSWLLSAWFEEDIGLFRNWRILACSL